MGCICQTSGESRRPLQCRSTPPIRLRSTSCVSVTDRLDLPLSMRQEDTKMPTDHRGPQSHEKITIFHKTDGAVEVFPVDANDCVRRHPKVWSREPWNAAQAGHGRVKRLAQGASEFAPDQEN